MKRLILTPRDKQKILRRLLDSESELSRDTRRYDVMMLRLMADELEKGAKGSLNLRVTAMAALLAAGFVQGDILSKVEDVEPANTLPC